MSKPRRVRNMDTGVIYDSIKQAVRQTGINKTSIGKCCLGVYKQAGGYKWEYVDDDINNTTPKTTTPNVLDNTLKNNTKQHTEYLNINIEPNNFTHNSDLDVHITINNHKDYYNIINYWGKKIIDYDIHYWLNKFIEDSKFNNEEELDASIHKLYDEITDYGNQKICTNQINNTLNIDIVFHTKTILNNTIEYWITKIIDYDVKHWFNKVIVSNEFKNITDLDNYLKQLYDEVVKFYG